MTNSSNNNTVFAQLNWYERKQLERKDRYQMLAARKEDQSIQASERSSNMLKDIPLGQPILKGHHSEQSHRNLINKSNDAMRQSVQLSKTSEYYENKANSVGKGGISSDDPDAIVKLKKDLQKRIEEQNLMKDANKIIKSKKSNYSEIMKVDDLVKLGINEKHAIELLKPDFCGRIGFASYLLTNNNANIKRIQNRIAELEKLQERTEESNDYGYFEQKDDKEENRILFIFPGEPPLEVKKIIRSYGFVFSYTRSAWVRKITSNALYAADKLKQELLNYYQSKEGK